MLVLTVHQTRSRRLFGVAHVHLLHIGNLLQYETICAVPAFWVVADGDVVFIGAEDVDYTGQPGLQLEIV